MRLSFERVGFGAALSLFLFALSGVSAESIAPKAAQDFDAPKYVGEVSSEFRVHEYAKRSGAPLKLFEFPAQRRADDRDPTAAVLLFHSGGWTRGRPEWLFGVAKRLSRQGMTAIPVQYRLARDGVTPIDALADACAAFRWVRAHAAELKVDPERLAGYGASAGGQLVAATATVGCPSTGPQDLSGAANALILISAGVDTRNSEQFRKLTKLDAAGAEAFSPLAHIKPGIPPAIVITGSEDVVAKPASHRQFCQRVRRVRGTCTLEEYPKLGHLLTRNLADQKSALDPDPAAEESAARTIERFLKRIGFLPR